MEKRGLMPEIEIDYESFCKNASNMDIQLEIPKLNIKNEIIEDKNNFEYYLKKWVDIVNLH